ncbi:MAG: acyl-[acyl-carrier-protein] thioesterase [Acetatifactor sp.]|nr:acyl-[acyl-carrier-protein] thioesterase [Acetatifactor sp.]
MYSFDSRVRYSEIDSSGCLSITSILNYFQDCSTFHSEDVGVGLSYMQGINMLWALSYWQIDVMRYPYLGEKITVSTVPYEFKGFMGSRSFAMYDEEGKMLAVANSVWSLLDKNTFRPCRFTEKMLDAYKVGDAIPMEETSRKITPPASGTPLENILVTKHHLDTNHHVNNGQYVSITQDMLPQGCRIKRLRAEYKKQALLGDVFYPVMENEAGKSLIALNDESGKPYFIAEYLY